MLEKCVHFDTFFQHISEGKISGPKNRVTYYSILFVSFHMGHPLDSTYSNMLPSKYLIRYAVHASYMYLFLQMINFNLMKTEN